MRTGKQVHELAGREKMTGTACLRFSADGKRLTRVDGDGKVCVWDVEKETALSEKKLQLGVTSKKLGSTPFPFRAAFFPNLDGLVVNLSWDIEIEKDRNPFRVFSVETGKELRTFGDDKLMKLDMTLSPDGKRLFSKGSRFVQKRLDTDLRLWDVADGKLVWRKDMPLHHGNSGPAPLAVSPDEKRFAVSIDGDLCEIWLCYTETGRTLRTFPCDCSARRLSFSSDGKLLATGMDDGTALVWDVSQ